MKIAKKICWSCCGFLLLGILVLYSCEENHIHGVGDETTEIRTLPSFNKMVVYDNIGLHLKFDSSIAPRAEIHGGKNLLPYVVTDVRDGVLTISNENKWNWIRNIDKSKIDIVLYTDSLNHIIYNGIEPIKFDDTLIVKKFQLESKDGMGSLSIKLNADSASVIVHTGAPDIFIEGSCHYVHYYSNGHGIIDGLGFLSENVAVHSRSTAEIFVAPTKTLGVTIEYLGNVYYKNSPFLLWVIENYKGRLIKLD